MNIAVLDRNAMGIDLDFSALSALGQVTVFEETTPAEVKSHIADADVVILNKVKMTKDVLMSSDTLRLICVFATGFDNIDLVTTKERGIAVCNVPAYSTESVVLFTVGTALSLYAGLTVRNKYVAEGTYTNSGRPNCLTPVFHELCGRTWGIIGAGHIGTRVAEVARTLGAKVIVYQRHSHAAYDTVDLQTLCRESDILTVHCPLNDSTRGLIGKNELALMKPSVILVNEARGGVIEEAAVADAIVQHTIGGFGCDVYSSEPFGEFHPYQKIKNYDNVILTPHAAWAAFEARERCLSIILDNIRSFVSGGRQNRVD